MIGEFCILRTRSAGIHMGYLRELAGTTAIVSEARRLWRWSGAFTLNEAAVYGVGEDSRISAPVARIYLSEVIEVIPCTEKAKNNLSQSRNGA